jgi:hypothetical protein
MMFWLVVTAAAFDPARAQTPSPADAVSALIKAYPDFLDRMEDDAVVWKDGTRMRIDDHKDMKSLEAMLDDPDIKDMFAMRYPMGETGLPPDVDSDPGRVRYPPLFEKMYGECKSTRPLENAVDVAWLPSKGGKRVKFSKINGAAAALQKVSGELDKLPPRFLEYLSPIEGTYNCRAIAGTSRQSAHGFGIAIDIASAPSHYWLWSKPSVDGRIPYKNRIPWEIVNIFEKHGFIWGGKWYHYDTMHFEYRPEILATAR